MWVNDSDPCTGKTSETETKGQGIYDEFKSAELLKTLFYVDKFSYKLKL